ncbi:MAG: lipoprotein intramolecular transacylase Lit [Panacagrimonas sp.]
MSVKKKPAQTSHRPSVPTIQHRAWHWLRGWLWGLALVAASLFLAWRALAACQFAYPLLYEVTGIEQTIQRYGPANRVRPGFQLTTRAERERLFAGIAQAIRHDGRGLASLRYHAAAGRDLGPLLTPPEIVHLQDVSRLVRFFEQLGLAATALFAALLVLGLGTGDRGPSARRLGYGAVAALAAGGALLLVLGPTRVFYALHVMIFPAGHKWFFYYEESLMSMMMHAPVLFGGIALVWGVLAGITGVVLYGLLRRLLATGRDTRAQ